MGGGGSTKISHGHVDNVTVDATLMVENTVALVM